MMKTKKIKNKHLSKRFNKRLSKRFNKRLSKRFNKRLSKNVKKKYLRSRKIVGGRTAAIAADLAITRQETTNPSNGYLDTKHSYEFERQIGSDLAFMLSPRTTPEFFTPPKPVNDPAMANDPPELIPSDDDKVFIETVLSLQPSNIKFLFRFSYVKQISQTSPHFLERMNPFAVAVRNYYMTKDPEYPIYEGNVVKSINLFSKLISKRDNLTDAAYGVMTASEVLSSYDNRNIWFVLDKTNGQIYVVAVVQPKVLFGKSYSRDPAFSALQRELRLRLRPHKFIDVSHSGIPFWLLQLVDKVHDLDRPNIPISKKLKIISSLRQSSELLMDKYIVDRVKSIAAGLGLNLSLYSNDNELLGALNLYLDDRSIFSALKAVLELDDLTLIPALNSGMDIFSDMLVWGIRDIWKTYTDKSINSKLEIETLQLVFICAKESGIVTLRPVTKAYLTSRLTTTGFTTNINNAMGTNYKSFIPNQIIKTSATVPPYTSQGPEVFGTSGAPDGGVNLSIGNERIAMIEGVRYTLKFYDMLLEKLFASEDESTRDLIQKNSSGLWVHLKSDQSLPLSKETQIVIATERKYHAASLACQEDSIIPYPLVFTPGINTFTTPVGINEPIIDTTDSALVKTLLSVVKISSAVTHFPYYTKTTGDTYQFMDETVRISTLTAAEQEISLVAHNDLSAACGQFYLLFLLVNSYTRVFDRVPLEGDAGTQLSNFPQGLLYTQTRGWRYWKPAVGNIESEFYNIFPKDIVPPRTAIRGGRGRNDNSQEGKLKRHTPNTLKKEVIYEIYNNNIFDVDDKEIQKEFHKRLYDITSSDDEIDAIPNSKKTFFHHMLTLDAADFFLQLEELEDEDKETFKTIIRRNVIRYYIFYKDRMGEYWPTKEGDSEILVSNIDLDETLKSLDSFFSGKVVEFPVIRPVQPPQAAAVPLGFTSLPIPPSGFTSLPSPPSGFTSLPFPQSVTPLSVLSPLESAKQQNILPRQTPRGVVISPPGTPI